MSQEFLLMEEVISVENTSIKLPSSTLHTLNGSPGGYYKWDLPNVSCEFKEQANQVANSSGQFMFIKDFCSDKAMKYVLYFKQTNLNSQAEPVKLTVKISFEESKSKPVGTLTLALNNTPTLTGNYINVPANTDFSLSGTVYATNCYGGSTIQYNVYINQIHFISHQCVNLNTGGVGKFNINSINISEPSVIIVTANDKNNGGLISTFTSILNPVTAASTVASF